MESRWYFFEGQSPENTKIDDREHALHVSKKAWDSITAHLDRKRLIQEALDKEKAHRKALKEGSEAMTRNWDNSIENIRKRKEEEREQRMGTKEVDKLQKFYEMREEQEAEREELIKKIKTEMFREKGYCKDLTSALVSSEVLYGREKQKEFEGFIRQHEKEEDEVFAKKVKEDALQEEQEKLELKIKVEEEKRALGELLRKEIKELEENKRLEKEKKVKKEAEDNLKTIQELEEIKQIELQEKLRKKQEIIKETKGNLRREEERKKMLERENKEMEEVVAIYAETKHKINCIRKQKEKEMHDAVVARRIAAGKQVEIERENREAEEEAIIKKYQEEREAAEIEKENSRKALQEKLKQERIEDRQKYLERMEEERKKQELIKKWEMLNRYKADEVISEYNKNRDKDKWQDILKYRQELLDQMADEGNFKNQEAKEKEIDIQCLKEKLKEEDDSFFSYADEVMNYAVKKGRPTYPIQKVILQYKKDNGLLPKDNGRHMCQHNNPDCKKEEAKKRDKMLKKGYLQCKCCKKYFK